ncbi:MAG TPA: 3-deoxy-8-phosphooctulonate synthase [Polyangiaceae bacterium]|nr:3-deoxy-8-phosphooctulonate synthase [Polyangiaceae bacterium]
MTTSVDIGKVTIGAGAPIALIAGPCVIESQSHALYMARALEAVARELSVPFVYKSSFDKANRSSHESFRGIGLLPGLAILAEVRALGIPVLTDIHETQQVAPVASVVDCLQIPAMLSRQTDLLVEAGRSGRAVNIKKAQFMAAAEIGTAIAKVTATGNERVLVTERGTMFGYNNMVVDFRSLAMMHRFSKPVAFDATHSVQLPGSLGEVSGGQPEFIFGLARAAAAVGIDALFVEVHDNPAKALSDSSSVLDLRDLRSLLTQVLAIDRARRATEAFEPVTTAR